MKQGYLSQHFMGVAFKWLSTVEVNPNRSNQHEFNGVKSLCSILGKPDKPISFHARFFYLSDHDDKQVIEDGSMTWYDARQKAREKRGVMRSEYRLYFPSNTVSQRMAEGDLLVIALQSSNSLLAIVAEKNSTFERQLIWLFGLSSSDPGVFSIREELETEKDRVGFAARLILEQLGIDAELESPATNLEKMLERFGSCFPKSSEFSAYARSTAYDISCQDDPDTALVAWMEQEERLFRILEKHLLEKTLHNLVHSSNLDTEQFIKLAQSVLQRRKSRAGSALENHLEYLFRETGVTYTRNGTTEKKLKPDFIFPGINYYHDTGFPEARLTMLASKSTCKDRWRQILNEAKRIPVKHLLTLEPGISESQTDEMKAEQVQLVLPRELHPTYTPAQQKWLMDVASFIHLVRLRQNS